MNNYINVGMDEVRITNETDYLIGTTSLATCVGVLLYNRKNKIASVAHISAKNPKKVILEAIKLLFDRKLLDNKIEYAIIDGFYKNHYNVSEKLHDLFNDMSDLFIEMKLDTNDVYTNEKYVSKEFVFDAKNGKFITDKYIEKNTRHI